MMVWIYIGISLVSLLLIGVVVFVVRFYLAKKKAKAITQIMEAKKKNEELTDELRQMIESSRGKPFHRKYSGKKRYQKAPRVGK